MRWCTLPAELVAEVATHVPLVCHPATLISLALTCHRLYDVIMPNLLYRVVWLEGEDRAVSVLGRLNTQLTRDASFSQHIRHLAIVSELRKEQRKNIDDVLSELLTLVETGGLHNLLALSLHLNTQSFSEESFEGIHSSLWDTLSKNCPTLTHVHLTGLHDSAYGRWMMDSGIFAATGLKTLRVDGMNTIKTDPLNHTTASSIEVLELPLDIYPGDPDHMMILRFPNLRTLILNGYAPNDENVATQFWEYHRNLERIELGYCPPGFSQLSPDWLVNLRTLKCTPLLAIEILPHVHSQLINLTLLQTVNAQALYLLRAIPPGGSMPCLRSLGIQLRSSNASRSTYEGSRWYEDSEGHTSEVSQSDSLRYFDKNYMTTLAKAVPELEELELVGHSEDWIDAFEPSLQRFRRLHTLIFAAPMSIYTPVFFHSNVRPRHGNTSLGRASQTPFAPQSLEEVMFNIGNGCRTLEKIRAGTNVGQLFHPDDMTVTLFRDRPGGPVKDLKTKKGWGRLIGREDEW